MIAALSLCFLLLGLAGVGTGPAMARTIAVFPLLDLSVGPNGVNFTLSEEVRRRVAALGAELVDEKRIMAFMVRHRIRTLGQLTRYQISRVGEELGADLLLTGCIGEMKDDPVNAALHLSLQLIRCADGVTVWAGSQGLSSSDLTTLLAIDDPQSLGDLYDVLFSRLLKGFPVQVTPRPVTTDLISIDTVGFRPRYVTPGAEITCRVRLHRQDREDRPPVTLAIRAAGQTIPMSGDEQGRLFTARWKAGAGAGEHTVHLLATGGDSTTRDLVIGTYYVDDHPPAVALHLNARERDGEKYFNRVLKIVPVLTDPEPISRWEVTVHDQDDQVVVRLGASQHIPRQLTWTGKTDMGATAADGRYRITFTVWDRAGWQAAASAEVLFKKQEPDIVLTVERLEKTMVVNIDNREKTPLDFWWARFFAPDGHLISLAEGGPMPARVSLDLAGEEQQGVECLLLAQDVYGNRSRRRIRDISKRIKDKKTGQVLKESDWLEEF